MQIQKEGKQFSNAETSIDMIKGTVEFNYPIKKYNENLSFFCNSFYNIFGLFYGLVVGIYAVRKWLYPYTMSSTNFTFSGDLLIHIYIYISIISGIVLFGYISLLIHKLSPAARRAFPKTNAIFHYRTKKEINLSDKYSKKHFIVKNKLYLFEYSITSFWFKYMGTNPITRIDTKSVDDGKYGEHYKFIAIFTFKKPIKDGMLYYQ